MATILFFDDWQLQSRQNLERRVGEPIPVPEGMFQDPCADVAWGYPTVVRDRASSRWRCFYQGEHLGSRYRNLPLLAESDDGIHWQIPDLSGAVPIRERVCPNQLFDFLGFHEWASVYVDPQAVATDRQFKALALFRSETDVLQSVLLTSRDALSWVKHDDLTWSPEGVDPGAYAFWNPYRESAVITLRPSLADRRIALTETRDWKSFTAPELALQADASDSPCALIYGMPVFPYEHIFVAFVWVFHVDSVLDARKLLGGMLERRAGDDLTRVMGKIDCYLGYSLNGWHFQRAARTPFLSNPVFDSPGTGCIYPSSMVEADDRIRIYSSSSRGEHAQFRGADRTGQSALLLHTIRRDGFVYLSPLAGTGEAVTKWLLWNGGEPTVNVSVPYGEMRMQVTDENFEPIPGFRFEDCVPFAGDSVSWTPRWADDRRMEGLENRIIHLAVRIANGRLFAIRGDFQQVTIAEARRFLHSGVRPRHRPGF